MSDDVERAPLIWKFQRSHWTANERSAELHYAVSQNFILRWPQFWEPAERVDRLAECNSAVQQSRTLRYSACSC
jgi:hypothetical protein